jgi:glyoxylate reductase
MIREEADLKLWEDELPPSREVLFREAHGADGLLSLLTDSVDRELLDLCPRLRVVSNYAVGFDNIDVDAATERGIAVGNTPDVLTDTTADLAFTLLMAAARRIVEGADYVRAGNWRTWGPMLLTGMDVYRSTLGIVGFGRIGQAVARRALGFEMRVVYCDRFRREDLEASMGVQFAPLEELYSVSDFISIHTDLNDTTRYMFNRDVFKQMKSNAILINTARGAIVDPAALYDALKDGLIRAAGLDVTDPEPISPESPLLKLPNCLVVPHIASASVATRARMAEMAAANLIAGLRRERLPFCVNPEVYDRDVKVV